MTARSSELYDWPYIPSILWFSTVAWRREWQPTPIFLPGYSPWGHRESDTTEHLTHCGFQLIWPPGATVGVWRVGRGSRSFGERRPAWRGCPSAICSVPPPPAAALLLSHFRFSFSAFTSRESDATPSETLQYCFPRWVPTTRASGIRRTVVTCLIVAKCH